MGVVNVLELGYIVQLLDPGCNPRFNHRLGT